MLLYRTVATDIKQQTILPNNDLHHRFSNSDQNGYVIS